ncbi:SWFGD domain-containing protein, partial [Sphingopyxis sp.]|uniref:SWFGD domain-containing protein n=1 Tax=Sphingopyxis sp. TaxID=1908224 RepID=UPI002ED7D282
MERQTNRDPGSRDADSDRETQSGSLHDWEANRDDDRGSYAYGGYPEAGFGPRDTGRYGDHGRSGRERTERGHYSADRARDYAGNDWNRSYGSRRYWNDDPGYGEHDDGNRYRGTRDRNRRGEEQDRSAWTYMGYADPYGWPTYMPYASADFGRPTYGRSGYAPRGRGERGFFERAGDEVLSWFGDEEAQRRRERDHRGRGPTDYIRSDDRIREDVNDRLT